MQVLNNYQIIISVFSFYKPVLENIYYGLAKLTLELVDEGPAGSPPTNLLV